jgi:hypothetical protein
MKPPQEMAVILPDLLIILKLPVFHIFLPLSREMEITWSYVWTMRV